MLKKDQRLSEGEWTILRVVWEHEPCAAPTVQEALEDEKGWAYTTVKTLMDRMVSKGLLRAERIRNLYLYRSTISRPQAQRREVMTTMRRAFNDALTPMLHFLLDSEDLSQQQLGELEQLIRQKRKACDKAGSRG